MPEENHLDKPVNVSSYTCCISINYYHTFWCSNVSNVPVDGVKPMFRILLYFSFLCKNTG